MMIKGYDPANIQFGNSFTSDGFAGKHFNYMLTNPPFGVEWRKYEEPIRQEKDGLGWAGRFGAGLPRIADGSLLFLQHMISKMKPKKEGTRLAIVFNGSPLFIGDAGSGESDIRKWIIENDWLEAIIGLPDQLFYNTGISTYIWVLTNRKAPERKGKVQLINAVSFFQKMKKSLGQKRNEISDGQIEEITRIYSNCKDGEYSKMFDNEDFGYRRITIERPLRLNFQASDERIARVAGQTAFVNLARSKKKGAEGRREEEAGRELQARILAVLNGMDSGRLWKDRAEFTEALNGEFEVAGVKAPGSIRKAIIEALSERDEAADICTDSDGNPEPDPELRDYENVPLKEDIDEYMQREVLPHLPDAWVDEEKTRIGFELPFTRHFYVNRPPATLADIERELLRLEADINAGMRELIGDGR
jgi:type I restriction enzyme M protein